MSDHWLSVWLVFHTKLASVCFVTELALNFLANGIKGKVCRFWDVLRMLLSFDWSGSFWWTIGTIEAFVRRIFGFNMKCEHRSDGKDMRMVWNKHRKRETSLESHSDIDGFHFFQGLHSFRDWHKKWCTNCFNNFHAIDNRKVITQSPSAVQPVATNEYFLIVF